MAMWSGSFRQMERRRTLLSNIGKYVSDPIFYKYN